MKTNYTGVVFTKKALEFFPVSTETPDVPL